MPRAPSYVLITPARNEAALIEQTLRSVVKQTTLPIRWVVVSDGSTDGTDAIVETYARIHPWIELLRLETGAGRDFARKARAFKAGQERLRDVPYDIIGNLDADVSFDEDYFAFLLERFAEAPDLGVAGTPLLEGGSHYDYRFTSISHVSGPCQLFRRECFEEIGGYTPVEGGGVDWIAVTTARMMGWKTRTFVEKTAVHLRRTGSASGRRLWEIWFRRGEKDYELGFHPLWELARAVYQSKSRPHVIGGAMLLSGYAYGLVKGAHRPISNELVRFHRAEQMLRLQQATRQLVPLFKAAPNGLELEPRRASSVTQPVSAASAAARTMAKAHICVCVCTYKRPKYLTQLLTTLCFQETGGRFTHSIVVIDNDHLESARTVVENVAATAPISISYFVEPRQNIALARNKAVEKAAGDFVALIDDDEEPFPDWLLRLVEAIDVYEADGVLGPVIPRFLSPPPDWVVGGRYFERPSPPTGTWLGWKQTRTGNALLRRRIFDVPGNRFRPEYGFGGEDVDFFRRTIARGLRFVWCAEARVFEAVPIERCSRRYLLRRALLRGRAPHNQGWPVVISLLAVPAYALALPFIFAFRRRVLVRYLISTCDHLGRILAFVGGRHWEKVLPPGRA